MDALTISNLHKKYNGNIHAVRGLDLTVKKGEVLGLLGPNGAGKSTTIKMLLGLLKPNSGNIDVLGHNMPKEFDLVSQKVGYVPQDLIFYGHLSIYENLKLFASLYGIEDMNLKIDQVLQRMQLDELKKRRAEGLSGGQKRRLNLAIGLLHEPELLILDEPSAGMDPQSRNVLWESIERFSSEKSMTIILTTHLMETADRLSDRIAIIDTGKIIALGTPTELKDRYGKGDILEIEVKKSTSLGEVKKLLIKTYSDIDVEIFDSLIKISRQNLLEIFSDIIKVIEKVTEAENISSINIHENTLEDVFIYLTGKELRE